MAHMQHLTQISKFLYYGRKKMHHFFSFSQLRELLAEDVGDEELLQVHVNME